MSAHHDDRPSRGLRIAPRGGYGNQEPAPTTRRKLTADDLSAFAHYNRGVERAKDAYAEHPYRTDARHGATCPGCEVRTERPSGLCRNCEEGAPL